MASAATAIIDRALEDNAWYEMRDFLAFIFLTHITLAVIAVGIVLGEKYITIAGGATSAATSGLFGYLIKQHARDRHRLRLYQVALVRGKTAAEVADILRQTILTDMSDNQACKSTDRPPQNFPAEKIDNRKGNS